MSAKTGIPTLPSRVLLLVTLAAAFALLLLPSVTSQEKARPKSDPLLEAPPPLVTPTPVPPDRVEIEPSETVRVETSEVMLPISVTDAEGRFVNGLGREDFRVFEDGSEQRLSDFALRKAPVDVALMVDASSSVARNLDDFLRAANDFVSYLGGGDRFCLVRFDDRVELMLDWTRDRFQLSRALKRLGQGMFTRFYDALAMVAREQFRSGTARHAIVVLTDGLDSGRGSESLEQALGYLMQAQASVYAVSNTEIERTRKRAELDRITASDGSIPRMNQMRANDLAEGIRVLSISDRNLGVITETTGGRLYRPAAFSELGSMYARIAEELRHQYAIYYSPSNKSRDGKFRRVRVETTNRSLNVLTRSGYFAPSK